MSPDTVTLCSSLTESGECSPDRVNVCLAERAPVRVHWHLDRAAARRVVRGVHTSGVVYVGRITMRSPPRTQTTVTDRLAATQQCTWFRARHRSTNLTYHFFLIKYSRCAQQTTHAAQCRKAPRLHCLQFHLPCFCGFCERCKGCSSIFCFNALAFRDCGPVHALPSCFGVLWLLQRRVGHKVAPQLARRKV